MIMSNNLHLCGNIHDTGLLKQKIRVVTAHSRGVVSKQTEQSVFIKVKQPKFQTENESETKNWIPIIALMTFWQQSHGFDQTRKHLPCTLSFLRKKHLYL